MPPQRNRFALFFIVIVVALGSIASSTALALPAVSFGPQANYTAGSRPGGIAVADFNRDGTPDLAVANYWGNSVSILLGNGDGTFMTAQDFGTYWSAANWLDIGDFNGDGTPDVVTAGRYSERVSVLLGNGDGTLGGHVEYGVSGEPHMVKVGDLDGDGHADLAVTNNTSNSVSVLLGNGDGTFRTKTDFAAGIEPFAVAIGDLNGDGRPDLVIGAGGGSTTLSVLLGTGGGAFGPGTDFATGTYPASLAIADVNADGRPDVIAVNFYSSSVSVLLGDGTGSLAAKVDYPTAAFPADLVVQDFNGDGSPDIAVCDGSGTVAVLPGYGDGTFAAKVDIAVQPGTEFGHIAAADLNGDTRPDLAAGWFLTDNVAVWLNTTPGSVVSVRPPLTCITPPGTCMTVPVDIDRTDTTPIRGFSVTVELSGDLVLCDARIVEGSYLSAVGGTTFAVIANGGGRYTVDCGILGLPCGAADSTGTLFTLDLGGGVAGGAGTVTVTAVSLRDCANGSLAAHPGPPASITSDGNPPGAVVLRATQRKTDNGPGGTTAIDLSWSGNVSLGDTVLIYRAGWGHYPEYDLGAGEPAVPGDPPGSPWILAKTVVGDTTCADEPAARDFWYYVAFVKDRCGHVGPASNRTGGTLNYHLGDVSKGSATCVGNNRVATEDISMLGFHYGATLGPDDPLGCLDVGPTTDHSVDGRPLPDDRVDFEDLMIFIMNYRQVSAPQFAATRASGARDELALDAPAKVAAGETFAVSMRLSAAGDLQGLSTQLAWDNRIAEPVSVEAGQLVTSQDGMVLSPTPGGVDAVLLGPNRGIAGEGVLATVTFRARETGEPRIALAKVDARDARNQPTTLVGVGPDAPLVTRFAPPAPNPFGRTTALRFSLAKDGPVGLAIFAIDGRRVTTLVSGIRTAGVYQLAWNGTDDDGRRVRPGLYYARLVTPDGRFTRTLVMVR